MLRLALPFLLGVALWLYPWPGEDAFWAAPAVQGLGALLLVCGLGKLLYDTLFYDRWGR